MALGNESWHMGLSHVTHVHDHGLCVMAYGNESWPLGMSRGAHLSSLSLSLSLSHTQTHTHMHDLRSMSHGAYKWVMLKESCHTPVNCLLHESCHTHARSRVYVSCHMGMSYDTDLCA